MNLPVDVRALYDAGKRLKEDRERPVRLAVLVEADAPDALIEAARAELNPKTAGGTVDVELIEPGCTLRVHPQTDAVIVLAGSGASVGGVLRDLRERAIPTAVVAVRDDRTAFSRLLHHPENDTLVDLDPVELIRGRLADWSMSRLERLRTALGHNFEFVRRAVARDAVRRCAWQNAAIGIVVFIPGADMPLMTMNQGRMLLQIAAAYGQPLETERVKELAAVVAGGFLFRTFARELVGLIPGFGWAVKGGIAYSGTLAMGSAAIAYFEDGADLGVVVHALTERAGEAVARVKQFRARTGDDSFGIDEPHAFTATAGTGGADAHDAPMQPTLL
ncbi:MAG TPA: DUF697 domain-containing protein, partial [Coriobacteriia bacterium]